MCTNEKYNKLITLIQGNYNSGKKSKSVVQSKTLSIDDHMLLRLEFCNVQEPDGCWEDVVLEPNGHSSQAPVHSSRWRESL